MTTEREVAMSLLPHASTRVVRAVDRLQDDDWSVASLLPGWSRAHVVAHLALNAEALARCLHGVVADDGDQRTPSMYDSDEQRDRDIAELAAASPTRIRDRLLAGTTIFDEAVAAVPDDVWEQRVERTPGGRSLRLAALPGMRIRELQIHEVDLDGGYTTADWPDTFSILLIDAMCKRLEPDAPLQIRPLDVDRTWNVGPEGRQAHDGAIVTGPAADIGWWLTGRAAPQTLSCSRGELPTIEGW